MIKIRSMAQAQALSRVLDTEAGAEGGVDVAQANDGTIGVSVLNRSGKIVIHTYVMVDGDTQEGYHA